MRAILIILLSPLLLQSQTISIGSGKVKATKQSAIVPPPPCNCTDTAIGYIDIGEDQFVSFDSSISAYINTATGFTLNMWHKTITGASSWFFSEGTANDKILSYIAAGDIFFQEYKGGVLYRSTRTNNINVKNGAWNMLTYIFPEDGELRVLINGDSTTAYIGGVDTVYSYTGTQPFTLAANGVSNTQEGSYSEISLYDDDLPFWKIKSIYDNGRNYGLLSLNPTTLKAWVSINNYSSATDAGGLRDRISNFHGSKFQGIPSDIASAATLYKENNYLSGLGTINLVGTGQSNMAGLACYPEGFPATDPNVTVWNGSAWITADIEVAPFSDRRHILYGLAHKLYAEYNKPVRMVVSAAGGISISKFMADSSQFNALETQLTASGMGRVDIMAFHQGEADADTFGSPYSTDSSYRIALAEVIDSFQAQSWANPNMVFIAGATLTPKYGGLYYDRSDVILELISDGDTKTTAAGSNGLLGCDGAHFRALSNQQFGEYRYYNALAELLGLKCCE